MEIGLTLWGSQAANVNLNVDAHSELISAYPWGSTEPDQTTFNLPDKAAFNGKQLVFTDTGTPPAANAAAHGGPDRRRHRPGPASGRPAPTSAGRRTRRKSARFNGSAVSEQICSQQTRSDLRELLFDCLDLVRKGSIEIA